MLKSYFFFIVLAFSPLLARSQSQIPPANNYSKEFALLVSDSIIGGDTLYNYGKTNQPFGLQTNFMDVPKIIPEANCTDAWAEIHSRLQFFSSNTFSNVPNSITDSIYGGVYQVHLDSSSTGNRTFNQHFKLKGNILLVVDGNATDSLSFLFADNKPYRITLVILGKAKIKVLQNLHGEILFKKSIAVKSILNSYTSILGTGNLTLPSTTSVYSEGVVPEYETTFAYDTISNLTNLSNTFYPRWLYEKTALNDNNVLISAKVTKTQNSQPYGYKVKVSAFKLPSKIFLSEYEFPTTFHEIPHVDVAINSSNEISVITSQDSSGQVFQARGVYVNIFKLDTCNQLGKITTLKITSNATVNMSHLYHAYNFGYGVISTKISKKGKIAIAYTTYQNSAQTSIATAIATISKNSQGIWGNPSVLNLETKVLAGYTSLRKHRYDIAFENDNLIICEFNEEKFRPAFYPREYANGGSYKIIIYNFPTRNTFTVPNSVHNYGSRNFSLCAHNGKVILSYIREPWDITINNNTRCSVNRREQI